MAVLLAEILMELKIATVFWYAGGYYPDGKSPRFGTEAAVCRNLAVKGYTHYQVQHAVTYLRGHLKPDPGIPLGKVQRIPKRYRGKMNTPSGEIIEPGAI